MSFENFLFLAGCYLIVHFLFIHKTRPLIEGEMKKGTTKLDDYSQISMVSQIEGSYAYEQYNL